VNALAEAVEPLYRSYLRRLDEMAARLGDAASREPILRDDAERPVRNDAGFVTRFDLADARSGETFEVHGAHADEPAAREIVVDGLPFHLQAGNWEDLTIRCVFDATPGAEAVAALVEVLRCWAVVAAFRGFADGGEKSGAWSGQLHSATFRTEGRDVLASLDLGTCPPAALAALAGALGAFSRDVAGLGRIVLGGTRGEDS
jgi:hypothetical protein